MVITGIYRSLVSAKKSHTDARKNLCVAVGDKTPYSIFRYNGVDFEDAGVLSDTASDIVPPIAELFNMKFLAPDGAVVMVRRGIKPGEIQIYSPAGSE